MPDEPPPPPVPVEILVFGPPDPITCSKCSTSVPIIVMGYDCVDDGTDVPKYGIRYTRHPKGWHFIGVNAVCPACLAAALA